MDGARGMEAVGAAAQDRGVAGLQAQRAGVGRHVRPALVDDADDAERRAHALDVQAVGAIPLGDDVADRIGQFGDGADAVRHVAMRLVRQRQAVDEGGGDARPAGVVKIERIGGEDLVACGRDGVGHGDERGMLALGRCDGERPAGGLRLAADLGHERLRRHLPHVVKHGLHPCRPSASRRRAPVITRSSRCTMAARPA